MSLCRDMNTLKHSEKLKSNSQKPNDSRYIVDSNGTSDMKAIFRGISTKARKTPNAIHLISSQLSPPHMPRPPIMDPPNIIRPNQRLMPTPPIIPILRIQIILSFRPRLKPPRQRIATAATQRRHTLPIRQRFMHDAIIRGAARIRYIRAVTSACICWRRGRWRSWHGA